MVTGSADHLELDDKRATLLATAMPGIWLDARGRMIEFNDAALQFLGVEDGFISGRPAISIIDPEDRHEIVNFLIDANAGESHNLRCEVRLIADAGPRQVEVGLTHYVDRGEPGFFFQLHDVTGQRSAERALGASEARYRGFFEEHTVAMYRTRPSGEVVEANQAMAELVGYPHPRYLLSLNAAGLYARSADRSSLVADLERSGEILGSDFELVRADGSIIWVRDFSKSVEEADGSVIYEGALFDVTERYQAQAELRNRALQQAAVSALGQLALQSRDAHAVAISASRMTQEVLGLDAVALWRGEPLEVFAEWRGRDVATTPVSEVDGQWLMEQVPETHEAATVPARGGDGYFVLLPIPDVDEGLALLAASSHAEPDLPSDDVHFLQAIAAVITATLERSEAQLRLEQLISSKDEFIASISHEVRTPLTVVMGMAHELQDRWDEIGPTERSGLLDLIVGQTQEMSDLIEDLLVAARADIGKLPIHVETMETGPAITAVVDAVGAPDGIAINVAEHSPTCYADPVRFRQILRNLMTNAFRYGGDEVNITVTHDDDNVWVEVSDNGAGVAVDARDVIFEPYGRAHRSMGQPGSVGLGLTVSRRLARLMDGDLTYRFDDGSVFTLELAAAPSLMFWNASEGVDLTG